MYQKIMIIGHLGRDPEMRYTPSGQAVTNFSVATTNKFTKSDGEKVEETIWFRVTVWGNRAEVCNQYLEKGSLVMVDGKVKLNLYQKKDETWEGTLEINAFEVKFLSRSSGGAGEDSEESEDIPGFAR